MGMWEHEVREELRELKRTIAHELRELERGVWALVHILRPHHAHSATLAFITNTGATNMALTAHLNDKPGIAVYQEWDGQNGSGNKVPPTGTVTYASDNPSVATVDASTGQLAYVSVGTATISASDSGNLPASDVLTVIASAAVSATLTLNPGQ